MSSPVLERYLMSQDSRVYRRRDLRSSKFNPGGLFMFGSNVYNPGSIVAIVKISVLHIVWIVWAY